MFRVSYYKEYNRHGKHVVRNSSALFTTEDAAKKFGDSLWSDSKVTHVEVEGGFDSKGNKI